MIKGHGAVRDDIGKLYSKIHDIDLLTSKTWDLSQRLSDQMRSLQDDDKSNRRAWLKVGAVIAVQAILVLIWAIRLEGRVNNHDVDGHTEVRHEIVSLESHTSDHSKELNMLRDQHLLFQDRIANLSQQLVDIATKGVDDRFRYTQWVKVERPNLFKEMDERYMRRSYAPSEGR
jgi:hypothetical protein